MTDEEYMSLALQEAKKAANLGEVPVGAVIVCNDKVVAKAHNTRETEKNATHHAELLAIDQACKQLGGWRLWQCDLYVTLEPCPMCIGAIINSRIRRVVYGAKDDKAGCCGSVADFTQLPFNHKPQLISGVLQAECTAVLQGFFEALRITRKSERNKTKMKKLYEADRQKILDYIMAEPEMNLFFIGDLENFGVDTKEVEIFAHEKEDGFDSLILRYTTNYIVYSQTPQSFEVEPVIKFLSTRKRTCLSARGDIMDRLAPALTGTPRPTYMSRCNAVAPRAPISEPGVTVRRLTPADAPAIVELFCQIDEFKASYLGHEAEMEEEERLNLCNGGRGYGAFYEGKIISYAQTSAENSLGAMITGVATLPQWRKKGFASAVVSGLCQMCFNEGMQFLCLFYDNPAAGSIYRQLGFQELGTYTMMRG